MKQLSDKQLAANRANAARSTGPRTPEGRSRSSLNACKHGLSAPSFSIPRLEDRHDFENLKADAVADYQPQTPQEIFAVERIALAQLSILRAYRLEAALFSYAVAGRLPGDEDEAADNAVLAASFHTMSKQAPSWPLLLRYQAQAERQYRRAVEDFYRLRADLPNEPISDPDPLETKPDPLPRNEPIPANETNDPREAPAPASSFSRTAPDPCPPVPGPLFPPRSATPAPPPPPADLIK